MADRSDPPFDQGLFLVHLNRGKEHFENRRYGDAAEELEEARNLRPNDDTVLNLLGLSFFKQEKYREADSIYRRLVEDHPDSFTLHFNLGLIGFKLGNLDDAEATFLRSLEIRPDNQKVHFYLGNIYERKGQHYNAIFQYRKAGANIMVKRVQEKIETSDDGAHRRPPDASVLDAPNTNDTAPTAPKVAEPWDGHKDAGATLEVINVDTINRSRFLSAIREGVSGTAAAGTMPPAQAQTEAPNHSDAPEAAAIGPTTTLRGEQRTGPDSSEDSLGADLDRESDTRSFRVRQAANEAGDTIPPFEVKAMAEAEDLETEGRDPIESDTFASKASTSAPAASSRKSNKPAADLTLPPTNLRAMLDTVVKLTEPVVHDQSLAEMARSKVPEDVGPELFSEGPNSTIPPLSSEPEQPVDPRMRQLSFRRSSDEPYQRMRRKDDLFRYLETNLIEVNFSGKVFIKQGTIYSYSGNLTFWVKPQREETVPPLVIVSGTGKLILTDGQREITVMRVDDEKIFVEPHHLLACQDTLTPRYASIERNEPGHTKLHVLAIEGSGLLALSVATSPLLISVKEEFPVNVSSANVISWSGGLTPAIVEDDALAELMLPNGRVGVNLRLSGDGQVMMEKHIAAKSDD